MNNLNQFPRINVLNVDIHALTMPQALEQISAWIDQRQPVYISTCNVYTVMMCRKNQAIHRDVSKANLALPDGMPLAWLGRLAHSPIKVDRITGADMMLALSQLSVSRGYTHFFYGGLPGVAEELARRWQVYFPELQVVGTYTPPLRPLYVLEEVQIIEQINQAKPDIIWVGLGGPKQDVWMADHRSALTAPVLIGVGAAFDFHSGRIPQAPRRLQQMGLEWLFRLCKEPRRLWQRYLIYNPLFVVLVLFQKLGLIAGKKVE